MKESLKDTLLNYFRKGEKEADERKIGIEMEHFVVDEKSLKTVSYYGENGVESLLQELTKALEEGGEDPRPNLEEGRILGIETPDFSFSIEPGAQFELALTKTRTLAEAEDLYFRAMSYVKPLLESRGQKLLAIGYQPAMRIEDIRRIPKERYAFMEEHFQKTGSLGKNMMKQTASLQVSIDYFSEEDFRRKIFVASCLSAVFYTLFDSVYLFEGEPLKTYNQRQWIWENTDPARTGLFECAFQEEFGYFCYAKQIASSPLIFLPLKEGDIRAETTNLEEAWDLYPDQREALLGHALSIVFPDIRMKKYLEIRMPDSLPYPWNFGLMALIKGIFYSDENLKELEETLRPMTYDIAVRGKRSGYFNGIQGYFFSRYFAVWGKDLIEMAEKGLPEEEVPYLNILKEHWLNLETPRDLFERIYKKEGLEQAMSAFYQVMSREED